MGTDSKIEWTHHTWNPWRGCEHVIMGEDGAELPYLDSERLPSGCDHCYAEALSLRNPAVLGTWGPRGRRAVAAEAYWNLPIKWDREAKAAGERRRVFALSLGDWLEDRPELEEPRARMAAVIQATPNLDYLLLTKRPENAQELASEAFGWDVRKHGMPPNVWPGASVEHQAAAELRIPRLLKIPSAVHFLSVEPLLGPVDLLRWVHPWGSAIKWVIVGGESGPHARPMHPNWARSIREQCRDAGVAFFFKQWGEWAPTADVGFGDSPRVETHVFGVEQNIETFGGAVPLGIEMRRVGKKAAGRELDGREWNEVPRVEPPAIVKGSQ